MDDFIKFFKEQEEKSNVHYICFVCDDKMPGVLYFIGGEGKNMIHAVLGSFGGNRSLREFFRTMLIGMDKKDKEFDSKDLENNQHLH